MNIQTVKTDAFSMNYICFGKGEKTFVILPGLSVQSVLIYADAVAQAFQQFADAYTVYLFDRRTDVPAGYSVYDMSRDTAGAMKALGLEKTCLFGASQGGMIAMGISLDWPELVRKLVLASTAARLTESRFQAIGNWAELARAGKAEALHLAFGEAVYPPDVFAFSRDALIGAAQTVTAGELARFAILAESMKGFDVLDQLKTLACPALVIGSRDDRVLGGDACPQLARAIPGAELFMYDGYGHAVYDTAPDFRERMLAFFRKA